MIIRQEGGRLEIIRQDDHARLSGLLAAAWGRPPWLPAHPFPAVAIAARQHDDAWIPYDEAPEVAGGRPLAFYDVDRVRTVALYLAGISAVAQLDPYAGLMVSLHYSGFFTSHWGWKPFSTPDRFPGAQGEALRAFLGREARRQQDLRRAAGVEVAEEGVLEVNYKLLQLWDRVSLDICRQSTQQPWAVEYPPVRPEPGARERSLKLAMVAPSRYVLSPYPLLVEPFTSVINVVSMDAGQASAEAFLRGWRTAAPTPMRVTITAP